jgi:hypothetical protein
MGFRTHNSLLVIRGQKALTALLTTEASRIHRKKCFSFQNDADQSRPHHDIGREAAQNRLPLLLPRSCELAALMEGTSNPPH